LHFHNKNKTYRHTLYKPHDPRQRKLPLQNYTHTNRASL